MPAGPRSAKGVRRALKLLGLRNECSLGVEHARCTLVTAACARRGMPEAHTFVWKKYRVHRSSMHHGHGQELFEEQEAEQKKKQTEQLIAD